ncbi:ENV2 protein, partial [Spelaeornis formosus]|nr:ENV2 protein [Elachura formosa]
RRSHLQDWFVGHPRNASTPIPDRGDKALTNPAPPKNPAPARSNQQRYLCVILFLGFVCRGQASKKHYAHRPFRWVVRHLSSDKIIKENITADTPSFEFKLRDMFPPQLGFPYFGEFTLYRTYWFPASNPGKSYCNYPGYRYCGYWGCETIVTGGRWQPQQPDKFLQVKHTPRAEKRYTYKFYTMTILQPDHESWATGKVWSLFVRAVRDVWVNIQIIRLLPPAFRSIGPNLIFSAKESNKNIPATPKTQALHFTPSPSDLLSSYDPFPSVLNSTFLLLNQSNPNFTNSCWLCYDAKPPFYESVAFDVPFHDSTAENPHQC